MQHLTYAAGSSLFLYCVGLIIIKAGSPDVITALLSTHIDASGGCTIRTANKEYFNVFVFSGVSPLLISCHIPPVLVDVPLTSASDTDLIILCNMIVHAYNI